MTLDGNDSLYDPAPLGDSESRIHDFFFSICFVFLGYPPNSYENSPRASSKFRRVCHGFDFLKKGRIWLAIPPLRREAVMVNSSPMRVISIGGGAGSKTNKERMGRI